MTKYIEGFTVDEAKMVYKKALNNAKVVYSNGHEIQLQNIRECKDKDFITAEQNVIEGSEGLDDLDYFAESINEILAQEIYTSDKDGYSERSYWPVALPYRDTYTNLSKNNTRNLRSGGPSGPTEYACCFQKNGRYGYKLGPISKSLFLADHSTPYLIKKQVAIDYYSADPSKVVIGLPAARGTATGSLGAGRCDSVKEVDYRWMGNYNLGIALGLEHEQYIKPPEPKNLSSITKSIKTNSPDGNELYLEQKNINNLVLYYLTNFPDGSEILYFKKFKEKEDATRKNRPENPETPQCLKKKFKTTFGNIVRKFEFSERKKKKEVPLTSSIKDREPAAKAMLNQLKPFTDEPNFHELKFNTFTEGEVTTKKGMGSAKQFAQVLQVLPHVGRDGIDFDQEWCHLRGHGDGGEEDASNFISGSKHCNSEQLAIEEGQRLWTRETGYTLRAKITTYTQLLSVKEKDVKKVFDRLLNKLTKSGKNWLSPTGCEKLFKPANKSEIADKLFLLDFFNAQKVKPKMFSFVGGKRKYLFFSTGRPNSTLAFREDFLNKYNGMKKDCQKQLRDLKNDENTTLSRLWKKILEVIELSYLGNFYPRYMRYKIELRVEDSEFVKVFDHVYNAQSESFDYNEFKILRTTVDGLIAKKLDKTGEYEKRIQKKAPGYTLSNIRFYRDNNGGVTVEDTAAMEIDNG